ncbi:hypothetical protein ACQ4PT_069080 [Festuca glaucescens]
MDMDVERSSNPAPPSSLVAELDTVKKRWWRLRSRARRALPAVCLVAATVLAFVVLSAAGDGWSTLPSSGFSVQDHEPPSSNLTTDQLLDGLLTAEFSSGSCRSRPPEAVRPPARPRTGRRSGKLKSGDGAVAADADDCRYLVSIPYQASATGCWRRRRPSSTRCSRSAPSSSTTTWAPSSASPSGDDVAAPSLGLVRRRLPARPPRGLRQRLQGEPRQHASKPMSSPWGADGNATWSDGGRRPPYVYLHLEGRYDFHDKLFYCDEHQRLLRGAPWLLMKTDSYLVPGLFLVPSFQDELGRMFPEKDAAFHHLGRYLFHPVNDVWRAVTRYYGAHLAGAGQRVGLQIRVFKRKQKLRHVLDQVLSCVRREKLLLDDPRVQDGQQRVRRRPGRAGHLPELVVLREDQ